MMFARAIHSASQPVLWLGVSLCIVCFSLESSDSTLGVCLEMNTEYNTKWINIEATTTATKTVSVTIGNTNNITSKLYSRERESERENEIEPKESKINTSMSRICKQNGILMHEAIILCWKSDAEAWERGRDRVRESAFVYGRVILNDSKCEPNHKNPLH